MRIVHIAMFSGAVVSIGAAALLATAIPATPAQAATQDNCVTMAPSPSSSFWRVTNGCPHRVIGRFCYYNDRYFDCGSRRGGGFGPIGPGQSESVSGPSSQRTQWRVHNCNYDDWPRNCAIQDPS